MVERRDGFGILIIVSRCLEELGVWIIRRNWNDDNDNIINECIHYMKEEENLLAM